MRSSLMSHVGIAILSGIVVASIFNLKHKVDEPEQSLTCQRISETIKLPVIFLQNSKKYQALPFNFASVQGISEKQLTQHHTLYQGYINKCNEIKAHLKSLTEIKGNTTYSQIRALKVAETFALNGAILHELYFENITDATGTHIGEKTKALLEKNFGSLEKFKENLFATASAARGWVLVGYTFYDDSVHNYLLDAHNELVPLLTIPLLIVDTYEHAYMIDFGINRTQYLETLWNNINWKVVEERVTKWLDAFTHQN